jgi:fibronectin type 3 domain-containing protein
MINMKKLHILITFVLTIYSGVLSAQSVTKDVEAKGLVIAYSSPQGNYLRVFSRDGDLPKFDKTMQQTAYFKVLRDGIVSGVGQPKEIGKITRVTKVKDFQKTVGKDLERDFRKMTNLKSDAQLQRYLETEYRFDSLGTFTEVNIKFLEVFGYGFLDKEVVKDSVYNYELVRVDKSGSEEYWGGVQIASKFTNPELRKITSSLNNINSMDSLVTLNWNITYPTFVQGDYPNFTEIDDNLLIDEYLKQYRTQMKTLAVFLNSKPQDANNTKFNIFYKKNNELTWHLHDKTFAYPDSVGNSHVSASIKAFPEDLISAILIPEDYATALGDTSDVANAYAISQGSVPLIYAVYGKDSTNCIKLNWTKLPVKPYYTGVTIARSYDDNTREVLAQLDYQENSYTDYEVVPGKNYTYYVSPAFLPKQNVQQEIPANVVLSCKTFSKPLPPFNLQVDADSKAYPKLQWEAADDKAAYGYFVYRGLSPDKLALVSTAVTGKEYTDSTKTLSGKSTYYYAVLQQNLTQDTSDFSNTIAFSPIKKEEMWVPSYLTHSMINNDLILEWVDIRKNDDFVAGYLLERKKEGETNFQPVSPFGIATNSFVDTTYIIGENYYYRIASISIKGDTSAYSEEVKISYPRAYIPSLKRIDLINHPKGIMIKWPTIEVDNVVAYHIYRRRSDEEDFSLLRKVTKGTFEYLDEAITEDESYVYSVVVVEKNGREGSKSTIASIQRNTPKQAK